MEVWVYMKIGVLMGGISSEREVSLQSGRKIVEHLEKTQHEVLPIVISNEKEVIEKVEGLDFIFIALHGKFGEDGKVQAILETMDLPYTGCGVLSSALCMDKMQTKRILKAEAMNAPKGILYKKGENLEKTTKRIFEKIGDFPVVVKPNCGGSSIGITLAKNTIELEEAIKKLAAYNEEILLEEYIVGAEYTVSLLGGEVLPILEIKPNHEFFDYECKYESNQARETEAELPENIKEQIIMRSKKCYEIFCCKGYIRIDIIIKNGTIYIIELNTLPGMTETSLFPKSAALRGISYTELLEMMISYSLER